MSGNALFSYDLTATGDVLAGHNRGQLIEGAKATDCRALCIGLDGTVWAGINVTLPDPDHPGQNLPDRLHLVSYYPGDAKRVGGDPGDAKPVGGQTGDGQSGAGRSADERPVDHGPIAISNPDYTQFVDKDSQPLKYHHGVERLKDGTLAPRYVVMGICAASDGLVYVTTLYPFTLHALKPVRK
jgi:hypothetical protein